MKLVTMCICILLATVGVASEAATSTVSDVTSYLQPFTRDSVIGGEARAVLDRLPLYERTFEKARTTAHQSRFRVDVIGVSHHPPVRSQLSNSQLSKFESRVTSSQDSALHLLERTRYDVIITEGLAIDRITLPGLWQYYRQSQQDTTKIASTMSEQELKSSMERFIEENAALRYLQQYPNAAVFGFEDEPLQIFPLYVAALVVNNGAFPSLIKPLRKLSDLRSELALAKAILNLRCTKSRRAAIIIGAGHIPSLQRIGKVYGVEMNIVNVSGFEFEGDTPIVK